MISYLDTSAAMKLIVDEPESYFLAKYVRALDSAEANLVASWLLHTELHCAASRHPQAVKSASVTTVLDAISLVDLARGDLLTAGTLPGRLPPLDAVHLAVALRIGADEMITYDAELGVAATEAGLSVRRPA